MALSGNLGFVPLDEVLRLLARAGQKGAVEVTGDDLRGRIFVTSGGITIATTVDDHALRTHLINSRYVDDEFLRSVEAGNASLESAAEREPELISLLREMTVESIFQMTSFGTDFEVEEEAKSPYASPRPFDLEQVLSDSRRRGDEWAEVEAVLQDMGGVVRMKRDLGELDEVTLSREAWKLLSELGSGSSISEMADRLGTTDFWTAKVAAEMTARHLLMVGRQTEPAAPAHRPETPAYEDTPVYEAETPAYEAETPAYEAETPAYQAETPDRELVEEHYERDPNQSWWTEPEDENGSPAKGVEEEPEQDAEPEDARRGRLGMFALNRTSDTPDARQPAASYQEERGFDDVEEDTEAFLEKVFSEMEQPESQARPEQEGHGLLRRRRISSTLPDPDDTVD